MKKDLKVYMLGLVLSLVISLATTVLFLGAMWISSDQGTYAQAAISNLWPLVAIPTFIGWAVAICWNIYRSR